MPDALAPTVIPTSLGILLSGISRKAIYSMLRKGTLTQGFIGMGYAKRGLVTAELERLRGHPITRDDLDRARATLDAQNTRFRLTNNATAPASEAVAR